MFECYAANYQAHFQIVHLVSETFGLLVAQHDKQGSTSGDHGCFTKYHGSLWNSYGYISVFDNLNRHKLINRHSAGGQQSLLPAFKFIWWNNIFDSIQWHEIKVCIWLIMQRLFKQRTWKEPDSLFEGWEFEKKAHEGRVSTLKVPTLRCLQLPLEFTLTTFQLTWCVPPPALLIS